MKNKKLFPVLLILSLSSCQSTNEIINEEIPDIVKTAVNALRNTTHQVSTEQTVTVLRFESGETVESYIPVDITQEYNNTFTYYYDGNERAYSRKTSSLFADLHKNDDPANNILAGDKIESTIRTYDNPEEIYYKNAENGTVYVENISYQNELSSSIVANYDENSGLYSPIIFDLEFKNPFDFISMRDIKIKNEKDATLTIINQKADFLADCYNTIGLNFINDNTVYLDDNNRISEIEFVINDLVGNNYVRKNTFKVSYQYISQEIPHYEPFTNDNPKLERALKALDNQYNFTYIKEFQADENTGELYHRIEGYFTKEEVYFHHIVNGEDYGLTDYNPNAPYTIGDYYDYKSKLNDNNTYTCYEYVPNGIEFKWGIVKVSGSSDYIIDNFEGIGPSFSQLNASIFSQVTENKYEIETLLLPSIGKFFDFGMLGVQSSVFDGNTTTLSITLDSEGNIEVIETSFIFEMKTYRLKFYLRDIGTTIIPSWSDDIIPVPSI